MGENGKLRGLTGSREPQASWDNLYNI